MAAPDHLGRQWAPPGDDKAKEKLLKQLKPDFPKSALKWLKDPGVRVDAPARVPADHVDWDEYPDWPAARQLGKVTKIAKKIHKGKGKASVMADRPGDQDLKIIDGHHHAMGYVDNKEDPLAYVVHVPSSSGPWDTMHDQQNGSDSKKDDFKR